MKTSNMVRAFDFSTNILLDSGDFGQLFIPSMQSIGYMGTMNMVYALMESQTESWPKRVPINYC